jgi:hypothetical protein
LKLLLAKIWQSIFGYDHRLWFPKRWDLSKIIVWKEYGGNEGFVDYYKSYNRSSRFVNGIDIQFYDDSFVVKTIVGFTRSGCASIAMNKEALLKAFR